MSKKAMERWKNQQIEKLEKKHAEQERAAQCIREIYLSGEQGRQDVMELGSPFTLDFTKYPCYCMAVARANAWWLKLKLEEKGYQFPKEEK